MSKKLSTRVPKGGFTIEWLYNALMFDIEPDLMTHMLPELEEFYQDETPLQREERKRRYAVALKEFEKRFSAAMKLLKRELAHYESEMLRRLKLEASEGGGSLLKAFGLHSKRAA